MSRKPFDELIPYLSPQVPVNAHWHRGRPAARSPLAYHAEYEFHFIRQGQGTYFIDKHPYRYRAANLVIIAPRQIHNYVSQPEHRLDKIMLQFRAEWMKDILSKFNFSEGLPGLVFLTPIQAVGIEMILSRIIEENHSRGPGWEDMIYHLVHAFIISVHRLKGQIIKPVKVQKVSLQLRQHVESNYINPECQVTSIAKHFGYSVNHVTTLFKETSGMGLKRYLLEYRIIAARRLLESNPELKVQAVARQVGFNQYRSFVRDFMKQTGMTPSHYRDYCHLFCEK